MKPRKAAHIIHVCVCRDTVGSVCVCVCVAIYIHCVLKCLLFCDSLPSSVCLHLGLHVCTSHTCEKVCVDTSVHASAAICMCVSFLCLCVMFMHTCVYAPPDMCECVRLCAPTRMYKYICVCVSLRCASLAATH